jgi:hypothetical protein
VEKEGTFLSRLSAKLELPVAEALVHFIVSVVMVLGIAGVDLLLDRLALSGKTIPWTDLKLGDAMFMLEVVAAIGIIGSGVIAAVVIMIIRLIKEVIAAWRAP